MKFHHIGLVTTEPKPGEMHFESLKVWGTNPDDDPVNRCEWVRIAPDSPLAGTAVAREPHVCYTVDDLDTSIQGKKLEAGPFQVMPGVRIAYFRENGLMIEHLEIKA